MQEEIKNIVKKINSHCPISIDQTIRLESCEYVPTNTMKYNYIFLFIDATKIYNKDFEFQIRDYIIYNTQVSDKIKELRKAKTTFVYSCKDEKGDYLGEIRVTADEYDKPTKKPVELDPMLLTDDNLQKVLQSMVDQTKKQLPLFTEESGISMIDCRTFDKTLEYTCKLLNEDVARFDTIYFKTTGVPAVIQSLKDNPKMRPFAEKGVYISNIYLDKNAKYLCTITISPEEYILE